MNQQPTAQFGAGVASYPPHYGAPSAALERAYRNYVRARVRGNPDFEDMWRNSIEGQIRRVERGE